MMLFKPLLLLLQSKELKARGTLLMTLLDKHQLNFNIHKDANSLMEAIEKWLQKLISQLEILGESLSQEDINIKFLRSLPSEWRTHTLIWRNKADLEDQSLDDLFNNLKIYEAEVTSSSSTSHTTQNIAFMCSNNTASTNKSVSAVPNVFAASTKAPVSTLPNVDNLSDAEMDLKWQMAMLTMRASRFHQRTGRNLGANGTNAIRFDISKWNATISIDEAILLENADHIGTPGIKTLNEELFQLMKNQQIMPSWHLPPQAHPVLQVLKMRKSQFDVLSYKSGLESVEARLVIYQQNENVFEEDIKLLKLDVMLRDNALVELRKKFEKAKKERDELKHTLEKFQTSLKNLSKLLESQITDKTGFEYDNQVFNSHVFDCDELNHSELDDSVTTSPVHDRYKSGEGYHVVRPPYNGTFMPPKPDLVVYDAPTSSETVSNMLNVQPSTTKPTKEMSQSNRPFAL
nr:hypothetical protein [Tanacetum cinerariifolium]